MLNGKVALVTGGGRGIGRGIAIALAKAGAKVVINDFGTTIDGEPDPNSPVGAIASQIRKDGGNAVANHGSVASFSDAEGMVQQAVSEFGRLDIVVHVAGILRDRMIFNMSESEWSAVLAVHLDGCFNVYRAAAIQMRAQRSGTLLAMSSDSAYGAAGQPNYASAKAGILGLTWSTANAMARYGVTANAIIPSGATRMIDSTPRGKEVFAQTGKWPSELAVGTPADPDNVAPLAVYLSSDQARGVSGQVYFAQGYSFSRMAQPTIDRVLASDEAWTPERLAEAFPSSLGEGSLSPFADRMLQFIGDIPASEWQAEAQHRSWRAA